MTGTLETIVLMPQELRHGLCKGDPHPDDWHIVSKNGLLSYGNQRALETCRRCPAREACLQWAIDNGETGIWGATTDAQRAHHRRQPGSTRQGRPWTEADDRAAAHWYDRGLRVVEIAERLARNPSTVAKRVQWLREQGMVTRPSSFRRWTPEEDARLAEMLATDMSVAEIAAELGRAEHSINARRKKVRRREKREVSA